MGEVTKCGYSISDAEELARVTTMFKAVGDNMTAESASEAMISTLKAYDIEVDRAQSVLDKYNSVANNFAIDTQGLAESLSRSGAALHAAGNEISESMGLIVAANDSLQDPSSVGQMLKTISMRLRGASVADLEELGIDTTGMSQGKKSVVQQFKAQAGIDIMEGTSYKSTFQILDELHKKWSDLNDAERAAITEAVGGKRGGSVMSSLMTNWEDARKAVETAENSAGSAEREMSHKMESIDYSIQRVKASAEELAHDALSSDFVKNAVEFGNDFLQVLDKMIEDLGTFPTLLTAIGTAYAALHVDKIVGGVGSLVSRGNAFSLVAGAASATLGGASAIGTVEDLMTNPLIKNLETANILSYISKSGGNKELAEQVLIFRNIAEEERKTMLAANGFIAAEEGVAKSGQKISGLRAMWIGLADAIGISTTALSTLAGVGAAVAAVFYVMKKSSDAVKQMRETSVQFAEGFTTSASEIENYKEEIKSLQDTISDSSTSYEDSKAARERLYEIQSALIKNYGIEADSINLVTDAINGEVEALDGLSRKQWNKQLADFNQTGFWEKVGLKREGVKSKEELMLKEMEQYSTNGLALGDAIDEDTKRIFDEISKVFDLRIANWSQLSQGLVINGTTEEVADKLLAIQSYIKDKGYQDIVDPDFNDQLQRYIEDIGKISNQWSDFYKQYNLNERVLRNADYKKLYEDYVDEYNKYVDAVTNSDETGIEEHFNEIIKVRDSYLKKIESDTTLSEGAKAGILSVFDDIAPEIQNKLNLYDFKLDLSKDNFKVEGIGKTFDQIFESVARNFKYTEELQNYELGFGNKNQDFVYERLLTLSGKYGVNLSDIIELLKERNYLESHAEEEYVQRMQGAYKALAQLGGMSNEDYEKFVAGLSNKDWLEAGDYIQDFISKLGLVNSTASEIAPTFDEAKQSVDEFLSGTDDVPSELETVKSVLADVKNVSQETYASLLEHSDKYSSALTLQNGRLTVNRSKLLAVANMRAKERQQTLRQATAYKKLELLKRYKELKLYDEKLEETTVDTYEQVVALQEEITQLDLLSNSLEQATDAFDRFKEAQETEDSPYYNTVQEAYKSIGEGLESGFVGTDDFKYAQQLLYSADAYKEFTEAASEGYGAQRKFAEQWQKDHAKFFTEDDYQNAKNFYDWLTDTGLLANGQIAAASTIGQVGGMSHDFVNAMIEKINLLDFDGEVIKASPVDLIDEATQSLTNLTNARHALDEAMKEGADPNFITDLEEEYKRASSEYESFMERLPSTFEGVQEKLNRGVSLSEALYGNKDGLTEAQSHNLAAALTTIGIRIDDTKNKIAALNKETQGSILDPESEKGKELAKLQKEQSQLQMLQNALVHGQYNDRKAGMTARVDQASELQHKIQSAQERLQKQKSGINTGKSIEGIEADIAALQTALNALVDDNYKISLELDKSTVEAQISTLKSELNSLTERRAKVSGFGSSTAQIAMDKAIAAKQADLGEAEGELADINRVLNFEVTGMDEVKSAQDTVEGVEDKTVTVTANAVDNGVGALKTKIDSLKDKTITITANAKQNGNLSDNGFPSSRSPVDGTAHADGEWGLQSNEPKALVGELGPEGLVRDGRFYLIGKRGPERKNLKKGDIIFNHRQVESLLTKGYVTDRGTLVGGSFVDGTLISTAHSKDTGYRDPDRWTFTRGATSTAKSVQKAAKETTDEIKDDIDEVEEGAEEATENFIDWIERQIKHFTTYTERYLNQAQKALDRVTNNFYSGQTKGIKNAVKAYKVFDKTVDSLYKTAAQNQKSLMETQNAAYIAYTNLTNAVGLDPEYQNRIKYGMMEIENVTDETLKDQITKWQDFYDKSQESIDAFIEAADKFYHMPIDKAAQKIENLSAKIEYLGKVIDNKTNYRERNAVIDEQATQQELILKADKKAKKQTENRRKKAAKQAKKEIMKEANSEIKETKAELKTKKNLNKVSKKAKKEIKEATKKTRAIDLSQLKEGTKAYKAAEKYNKALSNKQDKKQTISTKNVFNLADFQQGTPAYDAVIKYNAAVNASTEAWNKFQNTYEETKHKLEVELPKAKFDNIARDFTKTVEMMNHDFQDYDNHINLLTKASRKVSTDAYNSQKKIDEEKLEEYKVERKELEKSLKGIKQFTDEWYDAYAAIKEVDNQIAQVTQSIMEANAALRQLYLGSFDGWRNDIQDLISEQEFLLDLMSHEKKADKELGDLTDAGRTNLTSRVGIIGASKKRQEQTASELKELQEILQNSTQALKHYESVAKEVKDKKLSLDQTVFGNIDLDDTDRILQWTKENVEKYRSALESWGDNADDYLGSYSSVDAMAENWDGVEIAFTPMLKTDKGVEYLDANTVYTYIDELVRNSKTTDLSDLLALDAKGLIINGKQIKGLIADIGDTAIATAENMHYLGKTGALADAENELKEALKWHESQFDSVKQLEETIRDLYGTWQDEIKETYQAESAAVDIMKEKYQAELDMYTDLVSKRKESLNAEKDLYEYQKKIADKTKNIALLEKQLAAYRGDTSQEGQAKRQKLQKELTSNKEDLRDTEYDRYISDQQKMLDDLIDEYGDRIQKKLEDFEGLLKEANEIAVKNTGSTIAELQKIAEQYSYTGIGLNNIDSTLEDSTEVYKSFIKEMIGGSGDDTIIGAIEHSNEVSTEIVDAIKGVFGQSATDNAKPKSSGSTTVTQTPQQKVNNAAATTQAIVDQLSNLNAQTNLENTMMKAAAPESTSAIKKKAEKYIKEHAKTGRKGKFGEINQHISEFMGTKGKAADKQKVLSTDELTELAKIVGVTYKKGGDTSKFVEALKKYHIAGFAHGGLVKAIKRNGDDGIATLKVGEAILTPTDSKNLASLAQHFEAIDVTADIMSMLKDSAKSGNIFGTPQSIDYGGVSFNFDLPNVTDPNSFINAIKTDNRVQKAIQSVSIDRINNGGRLSVQRIK